MPIQDLPKVLFVGNGRAGKDTACKYLAKITALKNAGTTSKYLCKEVAKRLGLSEEEAYARRHESNEMRTIWYDIGNEVRANGPTTLIRMALENGEISGGIRDYEEIIACRQENLVDLIVWVENKTVPPDPTVKFTSKECDIVIENNGTLEEFHDKILRLAKFANLPMSYFGMTGMIPCGFQNGKDMEVRGTLLLHQKCIGGRFCKTCNKNISGTCLCFSRICSVCGNEYDKVKRGEA